MLAVGLAEKFRNFPILVEVCVLSGNQRQLHGFVDQFKDQVISPCPPLPAAAVTASPSFPPGGAMAVPAGVCRSPLQTLPSRG